MCKFLAPNGNDSMLFDTLEDAYNESTAIANYAMVNSPEFKSWYGDGPKDTNGEPIMKGGYYVNAEGELRSIKIPEGKTVQSLRDHVQKARRLTRIFKDVGVNVSVVADPTIGDDAYVVRKGDEIITKFNPAGASRDSIFHEFGHIYVDLLGYEHPLVQRGISQVKNTELWDRVAKLYPELNDKKLAKEVLTTAVGIEAQERHDEIQKAAGLAKSSVLTNIKNWLFWVNRFFRAVADKLGIRRNVASRLAYDLTGGPLRHNLTGEVSEYVQRKKKSIEEIVRAGREDIELTEDESMYKVKRNGSLLERATSIIEFLAGAFNRKAALRRAARSKKPLYAEYTTEEELARLWADKREEGTGIHNIAEQYVLGRNAGEQGDQLRDRLLDELYKPENAGDVDEDGVRIYAGMNRSQVENYIDNIISFLDGLYDQGYVLYPEVKVFDEYLGVAGTIDLVAVHPDKGVEIFDFKTKELVMKGGNPHSKFDEWNTINPGKTHLAGVMKDIHNTMANKYAIQLSIYNLILKRQGIDVNKMHIVPFIGRIEETDNQFNYTSLDLYTGSKATAFNGTTFELENYADRLEAVLMGKESIETQTEEAESSASETDSYLETLQKLDGVSDWIKEVVVDLEKSIARLRRTNNKEKALKYENAIKNLINKLMVTDEVEAINNYATYIGKTLMRLHQKLTGRVVITGRNADKSVSEVDFRKGYAAMDYYDIKRLKEENPEEFAEFLAFLINAEHFVNQVMKIGDINFSNILDVEGMTREQRQEVEERGKVLANALRDEKDLDKRVLLYYEFLESLGGKYSEAIAALKQFEGKVSDIQVQLNKLNKELDRYYVDISTNPLYNDGDILRASEMFFKAMADETFMQRHMDALADSHNPYMANVVKMYDHTMNKYREEVQEVLREFEKRTANIDLSRLVDSSNGKFIQELDYTGFYQARSEMFAEAQKKYGKGTKEYKRFVRVWLVSNTKLLSQEERNALINRKKKELSEDDYKDWYNNQSYKRDDGQRVYKRTKAFYKPSPAKWTNEDYTNLTEEEKDVLKWLQSLTHYLVEHTRSQFFESGYIPSVPKDERSFWKQVADGIGWRDTHIVDYNNEVVVDENGEMVNMLPFRFASKLNQQPLKEIPPNASEKTRQEIYKENDRIREANRKAHAASINQDLSVAMPLFIDSALKHKYKKSIEFELWRVQKSFIDNYKIAVDKNGTPLIDKYKAKVGYKNPKVEKTTEGSRLVGHYRDWMKMVFYEQFEKDEGTLTKLSRVLQNYTSIKGMGFNPLSAVNNQTYGAIQSKIDAWAGEFFNRKDWFDAGNIYIGSIHSFFADRNKANASSKASAFMMKFDTFMDWRELATNPNVRTDPASRILKGAGFILSKAYALQNASEHNLQGRLLIAMAKSHRVVNGKFISYNEYERGKLLDIDPYGDKKVQKEKIQKNKAKKKKLKEEWKKFPTVWDAYDFKDGQITLKDDIEIGENEAAEFERRVLGVNQYLHGIYNREDAGAVQQYALGRLAIQFRKWMRPGWTKRWGTRSFDEPFYNERRRQVDEGYYRTTLKFLARPFYRHWQLQRESEEYAEQATTMKALSNIANDYVDLVMNARIHWHSLTPTEKANIKRTLLEWMYLSIAVGTLYALKSIKGDDDDPPLALMWGLYQADRTVTELTTYVPLAAAPGFVGGGWLNETKKLLKSPTATFNTMENAIRIGKYLVEYPFVDPEERIYRNGIYYGESKLGTQVTKMVPFYNHYHRMKNLARNYKYYKLF